MDSLNQNIYIYFINRSSVLSSSLIVRLSLTSSNACAGDTCAADMRNRQTFKFFLWRECKLWKHTYENWNTLRSMKNLTQLQFYKCVLLQVSFVTISLQRKWGDEQDIRELCQWESSLYRDPRDDRCYRLFGILFERGLLKKRKTKRKEKRRHEWRTRNKWINGRATYRETESNNGAWRVDRTVVNQTD